MTARANIERVLAHHCLSDAVVITAEEIDRVYGIPVDGTLRRYVEDRKWTEDPGESEKFSHDGALASYREPNAVIPSMQICFLCDGRVEIDMDIFNPFGGDGVSLIGHGLEYIWHKVTRTKTNPRRMARLLDKRFGCLTAQSTS
jgi:hypothetical protein